MDRYREHKRLIALTRSGLLTADSNDALRRLVDYARRDFDVDIVSVSLMGETCLLPVEAAGMGTTPIPREEAFCSATIAVNETTVILDASIDPRWRENPLVKGEAHCRFYAGVPLRFDGQPVGTFCLIGKEPRNRFEDADRKRLEAYADATAEALELDVLKRERVTGGTRFEQMAAVIPDALMISDAHGAFVFVNRQAQDLFGYDEDAFLALEMRDLLPRSMRYAAGEFAAMFDASVGRTQEIDVTTAAGVAKVLEFSLARWTEDGEVRYGALARDVSERRATQDMLINMAHRDGLTGLPNRTVMQARLRESLAVGHVTVFLVDLDGFKDVNDTFGHAAGDEVLKVAAARMVAGVPPTATVTRIGGDEFVVLYPGCGDPLLGMSIGDGIVRALEEPFSTSEGEVRLGASVGTAIGPAQGVNAEELLKNADTALYRSKADGRHRQTLYSPALRGANEQRVRFGQEFHRAIERNEFVLHYQPQVRLSDGSLVGAEALLRWQHPELGMLQPGVFLAALLSSRHDGRIGEWVLRTACAQAAAWRDMGHRDFRMGVNASATHIHSGKIAPLVGQVLDDCGLPPENLEVEITETVLLDDDDKASASLTALRSTGVRIAFDDYGTGYASLSMLKRFPLTRLKIDRSFVQEMTQVADVTVIRAILHLAAGFGLEVIAEGIETEDQRQRLLKKGCTEGQGYLFGKPMSAEEFETRFLLPMKVDLRTCA